MHSKAWFVSQFHVKSLNKQSYVVNEVAPKLSKDWISEFIWENA